MSSWSTLCSSNPNPNPTLTADPITLTPSLPTYQATTVVAMSEVPARCQMSAHAATIVLKALQNQLPAKVAVMGTRRVWHHRSAQARAELAPFALRAHWRRYRAAEGPTPRGQISAAPTSVLTPILATTRPQVAPSRLRAALERYSPNQRWGAVNAAAPGPSKRLRGSRRAKRVPLASTALRAQAQRCRVRAARSAAKRGRRAVRTAPLALPAPFALLAPPHQSTVARAPTPRQSGASSATPARREHTRALRARQHAKHVATASCARQARARASPRPVLRGRSCDRASPSAIRATARCARLQIGVRVVAPHPSRAVLARLPT